MAGIVCDSYSRYLYSFIGLCCNGFIDDDTSPSSPHNISGNLHLAATHTPTRDGGKLEFKICRRKCSLLEISSVTPSILAKLASIIIFFAKGP